MRGGLEAEGGVAGIACGLRRRRAAAALRVSSLYSGLLAICCWRALTASRRAWARRISSRAAQRACKPASFSRTAGSANQARRSSMVRHTASMISGRRSLGERKLTRSLREISAFMREGFGDGEADQAGGSEMGVDARTNPVTARKPGVGTGCDNAAEEEIHKCVDSGEDRSGNPWHDLGLRQSHAVRRPVEGPGRTTLSKPKVVPRHSLRLAKSGHPPWDYFLAGIEPFVAGRWMSGGASFAFFASSGNASLIFLS